VAAALAGVAGVDAEDLDPHRSGLVVDKALKLAESPTVVPVAVPLPNPCAVANVGKIFEYDVGNGVCLSEFNDSVSDLMVDLRHKPFFPPSQTQENASSGAGALLLEAPAKPAIVVPEGFDVPAGKKTILVGRRGGDSQVVDPDVDA